MPTTITASTELELNQAIATVDGAATGAFVIQLAADIHLGTDTGQAVTYKGQTLAAPAELYAFNLASGVSVTLDGGGHFIDGSIGGTKLFRGLFVYSGDVTVDNLTIQNTLAKGGDGYNGGGGGAGLGGGLYVAADAAHGAAPAHVTLDNVTFVNTVAQGGGAIDFVNGQVAKSGAGGGLGGYVGNGTMGSFTNGAANQGGGGVGSTADGGNVQTAAGGGIILGAASGGAGYTYSGLTAYAGGANGGGGGGTQGQGDNTFAGGGGGVGGQDAQGFDVGGAGGYGGGGGEAAIGGFGGGGGGGVTLTGGAGGFGGGGGGSSSQGGAGGFGGGAGSSTSRIGGGGLGAGGAVFVQDGASLTIKGGSISQGGVTAGAGGGTGATSANQGGAFGAGVFLQGSATLTLAPDAGETLVISSTIADQSGVGGTGVNAGSGHVVVSGAGKVTFAATNALSLPIAFDGGIISNNTGASATLSGDYAIGSKGATVLANGHATVLSGALSGSGPLTFGPDGAGATVTLSGADQAFTGAAIVESGVTLQATAANGLPGQSAYTVKTGGVLDLHGHAQTIASLSDGGTAGGSVINGGGGTPTLTVGDGTSTTFSGSIGGFKENVALVKVGAGTLTLAGAALLVGGATVSAGTLEIGAGGTQGAVTGDIADNSALIFNRSDDSTYAGAISGTGTLQKLGGGALTLTAASGFAGKATVSQGGLYVDGSLAAAVAVGAGGSLGGAGTVGAVSVANGALLRPGSAGQVGTLHTGDLGFSLGATLAEQVNGFATGAYDQVKVTGGVTLTGATLSLSTTNGYNPIAGTSFELIDNDGSDAVTGSFANADSKGYVIVTPNAVQNLAYLVNTAGGDGNDVVLTFANTKPSLYNIPNSQTVASGGTLTFTGASNAFHLADADQGQTLTVTLTAQHGTLSSSGYASISSGDGTGTLVLTGTASGVDTTLGTIVYTSTAGYGGADTIAVSAQDDSGASNDTATGSVGITVTGGTTPPPPVNPPPVTPPPPAPTVAQQIASLEQGFASTVGVPVGSPKALAPATFIDANGNTQPDLTVSAVSKAGAIEAQLSAGTITYAEAREAIIALSGPTSAVAVEVYKFFTGVDPSAAGLAYLTNSPDNPNDLTDGYYRGLNEQNRFANLATSLATEGEGRAFFMQEYAGLDSFDAVARKAYGAIVGVSAAVHTGPPTTIDAAIGFLDSTEPYFLALNGGSEVKARAGLIGYMLSVAWDDHLGPYYQNAHDYLGGLVPLTGSAPLADAHAL